MLPSLEERLWSRVYKTPNCWFWLGHKASKYGYGQIRVNGRNRRVQVVAWELHNKRPFPAGKWGLHICDISQCVRPDHIYPGNSKDNARDAGHRGTNSNGAFLTHCKHGHEFNETNTYIRHLPDGKEKRMCRTCNLNQKRARARIYGWPYIPKALRALPVEESK